MDSEGSVAVVWDEKSAACEFPAEVVARGAGNGVVARARDDW